MANEDARKTKGLRRRIVSSALLLALLLLNIASDRLHNHPGIEEWLSRASQSARGQVWTLLADSETSRRPMVCLACVHHRIVGMGPIDSLPEGRSTVTAHLGLSPVLLPPPAPFSRPAGLRAPPIA
jgi:hypothetical protein